LEVTTPDTPPSSLDAALRRLRTEKDVWVSLPIREKMQLLLGTRTNLRRVAQHWVDASAAAKTLDAGSPWVGEEWVTGPWALAAAINGYLDTLGALAERRTPAIGRIRTRPDGQVVVRVFPSDYLGWLLLNGLSAEVWMQPGVTEATLDEHVAALYRTPRRDGRVTLVLSAGNVNAIAPLDALSILYGRGEVVILKMNPVNDYLGPIIEETLAPFVERGYLQLVYGGVEVGTYLTAHEAVDSVHMTGSARTHDAIVFGPGPGGAERRRLNRPALSKPITSELGGVGPTIVVPGPWSDADIRFQAEHIATMKLHNSGCNCIACQVLVLPRAWDKSGRLLAAIRQVMRDLPPRVAYYPGCAERQKAVVAAHPGAEILGGGPTPRTLVLGLDPEAASEPCFREETFGPVLAQTSLPGATPAEFLASAVGFANERLHGTLGATLLIHPKTMRQLGPALEQAVAGLHYGSVGVNAWCAAAFGLAQAPWGAYPGHALNDIQSGAGFVHNTLLLDHVEKSVVRGSFYPFPRSWLHGDLALLPKPPWFVTNRTAQTTAKRVAEFAADPGWRHLPGIFASALFG
jgi:aldehyde dehydrogenase (NAD(P)+)